LFTPNLSTVEKLGWICLECRGCRRRTSKTATEVKEAARRLRSALFLSDILDLDRLPFRCSACGTRRAAWLIPISEAEAAYFVAGGKIDTSLVSAPPPAGCGHR
jgi:hypothetical protein